MIRVQFPIWAGIFLFFTACRSTRAHPAYYSVVLGAERPQRDANHLSPSDIQAKSAYSCISTPPHAIMACYLLEHKINVLLLKFPTNFPNGHSIIFSYTSLQFNEWGIIFNPLKTESKSKWKLSSTDGQSATLSWCQPPPPQLVPVTNFSFVS
jgi:hypothetical protein